MDEHILAGTSVALLLLVKAAKGRGVIGPRVCTDSAGGCGVGAVGKLRVCHGGAATAMQGGIGREERTPAAVIRIMVRSACAESIRDARIVANWRGRVKHVGAVAGHSVVRGARSASTIWINRNALGSNLREIHDREVGYSV